LILPAGPLVASDGLAAELERYVLVAMAIESLALTDEPSPGGIDAARSITNAS
jgi:hypothetical protein